MKIRFLSLLIVIGFTYLESAYAEPYIGAALGDTQYEYDDIENGSAKKVFIGYRFSENTNATWAVEGAYLQGGDAKMARSGSSLDLLKLSLSTSGTNFSVAYYFGDDLQFFGKAGLYRFTTKLTSGTTGRSVSDSGSDFSWGIGLLYFPSEQFSLVLDVEGFAGVKDFAANKTLTIMSLGVGYHF